MNLAAGFSGGQLLWHRDLQPPRQLMILLSPTRHADTRIPVPTLHLNGEVAEFPRVHINVI